MAETIDILISEDEVEKRVRELAEKISADYEGREVCLVGILKGACFFMCDLAKRISVPVTIDFDVIIVEDIVDSGRTLAFLGDFLRSKGASSIRYCTLLDKPERRVVSLHVDYVGFKIPNKFVVGYGMDYDQKYRNLPYIGVVHLDNGK